MTTDIYVNLIKKGSIEGFPFKFNVKEDLVSIITKASSRFGIKVEAIYDIDGKLIKKTSDIKNCETLYLSQGADDTSANLIPKKRAIISVVGASVGKTSFITQYILNMFPDNCFVPTEKIYRKYIMLDGDLIELIIEDNTYNNETNLTLDYRSKGYIFIYGINQRPSFDLIKEFIESERNSHKITMMLVANMVDLNDKTTVPLKEGEDLATKMNAEFYQASAKFNVNVKFIFERMVRNLFYMKPYVFNDMYNANYQCKFA